MIFIHPLKIMALLKIRFLDHHDNGPPVRSLGTDNSVFQKIVSDKKHQTRKQTDTRSPETINNVINLQCSHSVQPQTHQQRQTLAHRPISNQHKIADTTRATVQRPSSYQAEIISYPLSAPSVRGSEAV